jgi:uncharacterized protein involved in exopolysaccharide biosynthesis
LTSSFVRHLAVRVRDIKTQKARETLHFIQERFDAGLQDLEQAERSLAVFDDRNANIQSARLRTEREQLQRQVSFKEELYTELQAQLTQAEIELQRSKPILTVIEEPVPPVEPSGPKRMLILIVSLFLGTLLGIGLAFARVFLQRQESQVDGRDKMDEIRQALTPPAAVRRRWNRWTRRRKTSEADAEVEE